jgi:hypothetical protein
MTRVDMTRVLKVFSRISLLACLAVLGACTTSAPPWVISNWAFAPDPAHPGQVMNPGNCNQAADFLSKSAPNGDTPNNYLPKITAGLNYPWCAIIQVTVVPNPNPAAAPPSGITLTLPSIVQEYDQEVAPMPKIYEADYQLPLPAAPPAPQSMTFNVIGLISVYDYPDIVVNPGAVWPTSFPLSLGNDIDIGLLNCTVFPTPAVITCGK